MVCWNLHGTLQSHYMDTSPPMLQYGCIFGVLELSTTPQLKAAREAETQMRSNSHGRLER